MRGLVLPRPIAPAVKPPSWLRGDWRFVEGAGTKLGDLSRYRNQGTITEATWATGQVWGALEFDLGNDVVTVPHAPSLDITGEITIELLARWGNFDQLKRVIEKPSAFLLYQRGGAVGAQDLFLHLYGAGGVTEVELQMGGVYSLNSWYHVVCTYEGTIAIIYFDGVSVATQTIDLGAFTTNTNDLLIGGNGTDQGLGGRIGLVRLLQKALAAAEVLARARALGFA